MVFRSLHKLDPPRLSTSTFDSFLCPMLQSARLRKMSSLSMSISCSFFNLRCLLFCSVLTSVCPVTHYTHDLLTLILQVPDYRKPFWFLGWPPTWYYNCSSCSTFKKYLFNWYKLNNTLELLSVCREANLNPPSVTYNWTPTLHTFK